MPTGTGLAATAASTSALSAAVTQIEHVIAECGLDVLAQKGTLARTFALARGIQQLRTMITEPMMVDIMALQGTALGFLTDKDRSGGYPVEVVKDCIIEGMLRGLMPIGNEINVIAGRPYATQQAYRRLVRELPHLTNLKTNLTLTAMREGGAVCNAGATWKMKGSPESLERELRIKVNAGMGSDAILGKALRKLLKLIYEQVVGSEHMTDGEINDDSSPAPPTQRELGAAGTKERIAQARESRTPVDTASKAENPLAETDNAELHILRRQVNNAILRLDGRRANPLLKEFGYGSLANIKSSVPGTDDAETLREALATLQAVAAKLAHVSETEQTA